MRPLLILALVALAAGGCKKKNKAPETPVSQPAPAPTGPPGADQVVWKLRAASFKGTRTSSTEGRLEVPIRIKNESSGGLLVDKLRLGVKGRDGSETCSASITGLHKVAAGAVLDLQFDVPCLFADLGGDELSGVLTGSFRMGGVQGSLKKKRTFPFIR